jgi:diguanylate cyclase (GGDEF)-like protein
MPVDAARLLAIIETQNQIAASRPDVEGVLDRVAERARELTHADAGVAELVQGGELLYRAAAGEALDLRAPRPAGSTLEVALAHAGNPVGALKVTATGGSAFTPEDAEVLELLAGVVAAQLAAAWALAVTVRDTRTDPLTGVGNRRAYDERLIEEVRRARRHDRELALAIFDLNDFKTVNDKLGHEAGDRVLREFAALISEVRAGDTAYRLGGDEFAVVMPETGREGATIVASRVAERVQRLGLGEGLVSVAWGVGELITEASAMCAEADAQMDESKLLARALG